MDEVRPHWPYPEVLDAVLALKEQHSITWRLRPEPYWCARLMQEVGELAAALVNDHEHSPDWELTQIASICLNWLEMRRYEGWATP